MSDGHDPDAGRLPRGRHHLSREDVERSQRARLQGAVVALVARRELDTVTVGQIVSQAGVSRETFYAHFGSKFECYRSALTGGAATMCARLAVAHDGAGGPRKHFEAAVNDLFTALEERRDLARCLAREPRDAELARPVDVRVRPAIALLLPDAPAFDVQALVRMIETTVADALEDEDGAPLTELGAPVTRFVTAHRPVSSPAPPLTPQ